MLERCCLRVSANVSYQHAAQDVELFTGIAVSAKTQQRLVQRQTFDAPTVDAAVAETSLDGGMVRLIVEPGQQPLWKQYKAVHLAPMGTRTAWFNDNVALLEWLNRQPLAACLTCLGDGHDRHLEFVCSTAHRSGATGDSGLVSFDGEPGEGWGFAEAFGRSSATVVAGQGG
jgi:hypothetical protein